MCESKGFSAQNQAEPSEIKLENGHHFSGGTGLTVGLVNTSRTLARYPYRRYGMPAQAFATLFTDAVFSCTALHVNQALSRHVPVYAFEFSDPQAATLIKSPSDLPGLGSHHSSSLVYAFQTPVAGLSDPALFTPSGVQESLNFAADHQCEYWLPLDLQ